jgi:PAS domain S-box-containing protein
MDDVRAEQLASMLFEQAPDAVVFAGGDGIIQAWNPAAALMFGFAAAQAIGQRLDIIIPEQFRERHWTAYARALAAGDTKYRGQSLPTRALKASGETFYVELSFAIVHGDDGVVIGALAFARDITQRFEQDRASRRRLRELEQEVHSLREGHAST